MDSIVTVTWASVNTSSYINQRFRVILPSQAILSAMLVAAGLVFCPGLFEVLTAETPPSSDWYGSLPSTIPLNVWGVYVLVLRRDGHKPLLYIGSGTAIKRGVRARLHEHDHGVLTPRHVRKALNDGFKIVHKALLLSSPIPAADNIPALRTFFVAVEAALTCIFGAFHHCNKSYGFAFRAT